MRILLPLATLSCLLISCQQVNQRLNQTLDTLNSPISSEGNPLQDLAGGANIDQDFINLDQPKGSQSSYADNSGSPLQFPPGTQIETALSDVKFFSKAPGFFTKPESSLAVGSIGQVQGTYKKHTQISLPDGRTGYVDSRFIKEVYESAPAPVSPRSDFAPNFVAPEPTNKGVSINLPAPETIINNSATNTTEAEKDYELSDDEILKRVEARKAQLESSAINQNTVVDNIAPDPISGVLAPDPVNPGLTQ